MAINILKKIMETIGNMKCIVTVIFSYTPPPSPPPLTKYMSEGMNSSFFFLHLIVFLVAMENVLNNLWDLMRFVQMPLFRWGHLRGPM